MPQGWACKYTTIWTWESVQPSKNKDRCSYCTLLIYLRWSLRSRCFSHLLVLALKMGPQYLVPRWAKWRDGTCPDAVRRFNRRGGWLLSPRACWDCSVWLMTCIKMAVPDGDRDFRVECEILIKIVKDDRFIEEVLGYEKVRALRCTLRLPMRVKLQCEVNLMQWINVDFVLEDSIFIDDAFEIDPHLDGPELAQQ